MTKQINLHLKRIVLLVMTGVLMVTGLGFLPIPRAAAWGTTAPDTGVLRLRHGTDGATHNIPLRAFYTSYVSNPTMTINKANGQSEPPCEGSNSVYMNAGGQSWKCNNYTSKTVTLPNPSWDPIIKKWVSNADVNLIRQNNNESWNHACPGNSNSNGGGCDAKFKVHLNNGSDSILGMESSQNPNGFDAWGASTYDLPFGPPPNTCGQSSVPGYIGVYDPDSSFTLKLYHLTSGGPSLMASHNIPSNNHAEYKFTYNFVPGEQYKIVLNGVNAGDTVVPYFPFPTVYGQVGYSCWSVTVDSSATTTSQVPVAPASGYVYVDPSAGQSGTIKWTHTVTNVGNASTPPLNLTYSCGSIPAAATPPCPNPPIPTQSNAVIGGNGGTNTKTYTLSIPASTPPGTIYCQSMTSNHHSVIDSSPVSSSWACVTVAWPPTRPYFQVLRGDVNSSGCSGSVAVCGGNGTIRGWQGVIPANGALGQIAALARGTIDGFPSYNGQGSGKVLDFANTGTLGNFGGSYTTGLPATTEPGPVTIGNGLSGSNAYDPNNYTRLVSGDIYIKSDIIGPTSFGLDTLKFTRLVATGNIYIAPNVNQIDAILQAGNTIYTCAPSAGFTGLTSSQQNQYVAKDCRRNVSTGVNVQPLRISGALSAKNIKLLRSSGNTGTANTAAETIDFVPMAWLQSISGGGPGSFSGTYDAYTSLPPVL